MQPENFRIELKNQSKRLKSAFDLGIKTYNCSVLDSYEFDYFQGKSKWRNPINFLVRFPNRNDRWAFIKLTGIWVASQERIQIGLQYPPYKRPICFQQSEKPTYRRRSYWQRQDGWIKDSHPTLGAVDLLEIDVNAVLDGHLELLPGFD